MRKSSSDTGLEKILKRQADIVYSVAASVSGDRDDAEDITQNVLLKAARRVKEEGAGKKLSSWIRRTAYLEALAFMKRKYGQIRTFKDRGNSEGKDINWLYIDRARLPEEELLDDELVEQLHAAITEMPLRYRMPLVLHKLRGLSVRESAGVLGLAPGSVKTGVSRAYKLIRSRLADYVNDRQPKTNGARPAPACGRWVGFVRDYENAGLEKGRRAGFQKHIKDCPACRSFLDSYRRAIRITGALECQDIKPRLREKITTYLAHG